MYELKITVEIPGLPEALNALANALTVQVAQIENTDVLNINNAVAENPAPAPVETVEQELVAPAPPAPPAPPATNAAEKSYTVDDLGRAGAALIDQGKMAQLLDLLKKYGAQAVTQLDESVYPAFVDELKALGAQF